MFMWVQPHRVAWRWKRATGDLERNDYFMFGAPESLAVGGGGHFALFLQAFSPPSAVCPLITRVAHSSSDPLAHVAMLSSQSGVCTAFGQ